MTYSGKVSIVIPCYNYGPMLLETLASIERVRSDSIAEVIIVDDGSTDPTTCRIFEELDPALYTVFHQPNQGLGRARNAGIEIAKGEFILPLDSDNLIRSAYFDRGVAMLNENPDAGVVYGDVEYFGEKAGRWRVAEFDVRVLVKENYIDACALYRRKVWESVSGYDEKMPVMGLEDWDFWMRVALRGWRFIHLDDIAFDYRVREGSMLTNTNKRRSELLTYIFEKPENGVLKILKGQGEEIEGLLRIRESREYKMGHSIVASLLRIKRLVSGAHR